MKKFCSHRMKKQVVLSGLALASLSIASGCHINFNSVRYNVDFYVDGELYQSVGTDGKTIEMPKEPTKDGYQFGGWYTEENGEGDLITLYTLLNQPLSTNIRLTIHAHFLEELTVSFVTGTNEIIEDVTYVEGDTISALTPEIVPEDKLFGGWFTDEQCTQKWDYDAKLETDMTFYAGWISKYVTITYIYNLEGVENTTVQATRYERTAEVVPDKRDDGTFIGWYTDERFTIAWDFSKTVDSDLTLYANWYSKYVTVTFDFQHEDLENQKVKIERGEKISEIIPNKTPLYHEFKEWRYEGKKWDFNSPVEKDMTLSASWKNNTGKSVSVVYVLFSGGKVYGLTKIGSLVEDMSGFQTLKAGERFAGWFTDENFTQPWDILNDRADKTEMTLYAKVEKISYTLSFETQGLGRLPNISVNHGETIELPLLYKDDYYLSAWEGTREDGTTFMIEKIYTVYNVGGVEFEEGSQLQYMGPDFFDWDKSYGQSDDIFLPKGIKYMASNAWHGGRVNVFVPEESKPEGWADDWCSASNEIIYGATKDNVVTIGDAVYVLYDNEAMLLHLRNTTNTYSLPETVAWDGKEYALTKMGNWCISSIQSDLIYLAIPATVTKIVTTIPSSTQYTINVFLFEMDHDSSGTLPSNSIFGVTAQDYIMQEEAHFIRRGDYAEAYRFLWKGDSYNPNVYVLPQTVKALDDEIPVSHISRNFLGTLSYVQLYFYNTVTDIPKGKTYGYGVSIYTEHDVAPKGWETDWNECYGGSSMNPKNYMPVTYGVTGLTEGLKTYTFMENGEELKKFTAQFAPSAPILSVSGKYFWGWYDNAEFTGNVIEFPYVGESTSFYARFENTQIQDGKSQDTAYVLKVGSYMPVEITKPGQTVYFQYTVEKEQTYTFKSRGDYDTIGRIYYMKRVISIVREETVASADSGGSGENFSMTETLLDITYYFTVRLVDSTETGSFEVILSAL